ncbi:hypothetical protein SAMN02745136_03432 [Anaerocolumna jejuensis DSM 15929]|uniref:Uncharacterized protein n=1 Tax=Anaerocolumna jejuensis DSM 15929 TaxID=1121322 RepID=A0A1M6VNS2_9FIRM|nr:hypothetical protein [Anaerocolumna jejuensis]SHK82886.1 hypothetical protein SAMN02745136_03432 [Anaerocolumna jejuensis DSM 15929]
MKSNLRVLSIIAFVIAVPSLIITDWYYKGYGIFMMFIFLTIGLVLDQIIRLKFPVSVGSPLNNYKINKILNIVSLVLFVQSPMGLIYGNKCIDNLGFWTMAIMICLGIIINQIAANKYHYTIEK